MNANKKTNVGRKKSADPKVNIQFYIEQSKVDAMGGMEATRSFCVSSIDNEIEIGFVTLDEQMVCMGDEINYIHEDAVHTDKFRMGYHDRKYPVFHSKEKAEAALKESK